MPTLKELAAQGDKRGEVVEDACRVLDLEVGDKSGVSGIAIKGAYKLVKGVKPGFIPEVVDHLLDDFLDALDPLYQEAKNEDVKPGAHLRANGSRVADALLAITDKRAETAQRAMIKKTYLKLRPTAKKHVEAAAPRLGEMLDRHVPS